MKANFNNCKKVFVGKGYQPQLYKWSPGCQTFQKNVGNIFNNGGNITPTFCDATDGSQGEDWVTTYVYNISLEDFMQKRKAYVSCGYVE